MKKFLALFLCMVILSIFTVPSMAADVDKKEDIILYRQLDSVSEKIVSNSLATEKFCNLSEKSITYLKENGVDTDKVGKISYSVEDDILILKAITLNDDDSVTVSTMSFYGENDAGEYQLVDNLKLVDEVKSLSWFNLSTSGYSTSEGITFTATVNYYYSSFYEGLVYYFYVRPYSSTLLLSYSGSSRPTVENYSGSTRVIGALCNTNGSVISDSWTWLTYYNITSPSFGTTYSRTNYLASDEMIDYTAKARSMHHEASVSINGNNYNFVIYIMM